jgi:hypothetical protein
MGFADPKDFESAIDCLAALDAERAEHAKEVSECNQLRHETQNERDNLLEKVETLEENAANLEVLKAMVTQMWSLIKQSEGVYGLHLNSDPSPWDELLPGGTYEEWLNQWKEE